MRLCVLVSSYEQSTSPFRSLDSYPEPEKWLPEHAWTTCLVERATAANTVQRLAREGFDAFVNLCDGAAEEDRAGVEVVLELERLGLPYTGATPAFYEPTRLEMKRACAARGIGTPRHAFAKPGDVDVARGLGFPMLVKHQNGYGSVGITPASLVTDRAALARQVDHMLGMYGGALVEEFIAGREYMVLVAEGAGGATRSYPAVESLFPEGETFKHFELKWMREGLTTVRVDDRGLAGRLEAACAAVFRQMGGAGYARCDVRQDASGELFVIDVNPNPVIFSPPEDPAAADRILQLAPGGHRSFLAHAVEVARARSERLRAAATA